MTKKTTGLKLPSLAAALASAATALNVQIAEAKSLSESSSAQPITQSQAKQEWKTVTKPTAYVPHITFPADINLNSTELFLMELNELVQNKKKGEEIVVIFPDSVGGLVDSANDIKGRINQIIKAGNPVTYILTGQVGSASAALVLAHTGTVLATKDAELVTHAGFFSVENENGDLVPFKTIDSTDLTANEKTELTAIRNQFAHDIYARSCRISKELAPLFFATEDTAMDMKSALKLNIIDDIVLKDRNKKTPSYVIDKTQIKYKMPCPNLKQPLETGPKR